MFWLVLDDVGEVTRNFNTELERIMSDAHGSGMGYLHSSLASWSSRWIRADGIRCRRALEEGGRT